MNMRVPTLLFTAALFVASAACGTPSPDGQAAQAEGTSSWERLADSPLSPRTGAVGVWTGEEVLVFGGEQWACPPTAGCAAPDEPPLSDGAAYNPATNTWRAITDALVSVSSAQAVAIDDSVYVWAPSDHDPQTGPTFMVYSLRNDTWRSLPQPARAEIQGPHSSVLRLTITGAGQQIVGYSTSDEQGEHPDWLYDPVAGWSQLPDDPHSDAFDRTMVWAGDRLVLIDKENVPNPNSERPSLARAATLDLHTATWQELPDSETLAYGPWLAENGTLVAPIPGSADGGETNNWGRHYPNGGILDLVEERWAALPPAPAGAEFAAGVVGAQGALFTGHRGVVLDLLSDRWVTVPPLDEPEQMSGRTVVAAGTDLFVFGGVNWSDLRTPHFHHDAWRWAPRPGDKP
jgi:hypothetical protein